MTKEQLGKSVGRLYDAIVRGDASAVAGFVSVYGYDAAPVARCLDA